MVWKFSKRENKGISEIIASVLTILFSVLMLTLVLTVVNPTFNRAQDSSVVTDAFQNLDLLNSAIKEVSSESQGSKRTISISVSSGEYSINSTMDLLMFKYDPSEDMHLTGKKGDTYIQHDNIFLDFFNWYVDGGTAAPVWKNTSGKWNIDSYKYKGNGGLAYTNLSVIQDYKFSGDIYNSSGTGGQIFVLPVNPEHLVGFWPFDNATGSRAYDYSGRQNNGSLVNMSTTGNGTSGWQDSSNCTAGKSCLMFDGINDYVTINYSANFAFTNKVTVDAWVYLPAGWDSSHATSSTIVKSQNDTNGFSLFLDGGTGQIGFWIYDTAQRVTKSATTTWSAGWYHLAGVYDGSGVKLYVNGARDGTTTAATGNIANLQQNISIGYSSYEGAYPFNGTIDEVKIWNTALTADEVAAEYELSAKKLAASGGSQSISAKTNASLVLANPDGISSFDNIIVDGSQKDQTFVIPYSNIDINGTLRIAKGDYRVTIQHMGTNTTLNKPTVQITS